MILRGAFIEHCPPVGAHEMVKSAEQEYDDLGSVL